MYGLEPNWEKTLHLQIRHNGDIFTPQGTPVKVVTSAVYLGSLLRADGRTGASTARRIGEARATFDSLKTVWKHANITRQRKLYIFNACVATKLTYSLEALCLRQADRDKLDAFQAQCLRKIFGIPRSMFSHVSNEAVRTISRQSWISLHVLSSQLVYFDKLKMAPNTSLVRSFVFQNESSDLVVHGKRGRGRPRLQWATVVQAHAQTIQQSHGQAVLHGEAWRRAVSK